MYSCNFAEKAFLGSHLKAWHGFSRSQPLRLVTEECFAMHLHESLRL